MILLVNIVKFTKKKHEIFAKIYRVDFILFPSPNLAFLCRNLDYKPYSINYIVSCNTNLMFNNSNIIYIC